jgi:FHA domain
MERSRAARVPMQRRSRRRWLAAAGIAVCWAILLDQTGSIIAATLVLVLLAALTVVTVVALRALGVNRNHPWVQQMSARPWRDGQDVLRVALRHLPEVFVVTPSGSLLAPDHVELRMNPDDLRSLGEHMELGLAAQSAAEVYVDQVTAHGARPAGPGPAEVRIIPDDAVPPGRYRLRQGQPVNVGSLQGFQPGPQPGQQPGPQFAHAGAQAAPQSRAPGASVPAFDVPRQAPQSLPGGFVGHDGNTRAHPESGMSTVTGMPTVIELPHNSVPMLRLVTGGAVTETRVSGARAGRGHVELKLPAEPTVSREHARFTFSDGQWWIGNLGRNGITVNGAALAGEQPLHDGDSIRWGMRPDALLSRVEIR